MNFLEKTLGFDPKTMKLRTELIAGVTTFLTMSYILAVNPAILMSTGMDQGALFTATALASAIATLLLAFMAKLPFAQAPSMGLNAFFAYTLCQAMGYSWQNSLAILLIEGIVFILITFFNVREMIFNAIPNNLRYAISAGIGMFIAFIGLKNAEIIVSKEGTFVGLGAFTAPCLLGIFATLLSGVLMARNVKGALFWGIIATTLIGIPLGVTVFPDHWLPVSAPQDISPIFCQFDFSGLLNLKTVLVVFSLLIVNIFDTIGTLMGLAEKTGIVREDGSIPRVSEAMMSDAIGTTCGAMLGSSTISTYIESASGIAEGGRSGVTSLVVGAMFIFALFLSPIFLLIPSAATSGALIMVGVLMLDSVKKINLQDMTEAFPAFITMITMVLCYSIADGICLGILSFVIMKLCTHRWKDLNWTLCILSILFVLNFALG
ncbi:NCS2 family permease [Prevotella intermedia]|jgi:putative permease|uniref:NCS2 family permease n=1 Tax=Prevotella intermedia TaxID=28131 RepID=A0A0S3UIN3_PREIN|nr:NCS2 family permease [Prevotella intermedia]ATV31440.1 NCS2 family permease [Prevotella intermedia]AWX07561.1 NCS2 family permease [Prevotella intermedia]PJI22304.1 NCS2 family permease [Prevotella intermedia]PJI27463.1 NCS2 family permease [Prevotella intermedia]RQE03748.1 NCS2 family permease [Prevotella intermedia]